MGEVDVIGPEDRRLATNAAVLNRLTGRLSDQLLKQSHVRDLSKGEMIFRIGEMPDHLHLVLKGCVALTGRCSEGRETVIEFLEPGECFVLAAVVLNTPYLLSARAATDIRVLNLPAERLRALLESNHPLSVASLEALAAQWRQLVGQVTDLKLKSSAQRLGAYLLTFAKGNGDIQVRLPSERQLVAARLGMTPESLSRAFARLRPLGVLGHGQTVTIKDTKRLRSFCEAHKPD